jgi:hypothetical protein
MREATDLIVFELLLCEYDQFVPHHCSLFTVTWPAVAEVTVPYITGPLL